MGTPEARRSRRSLLAAAAAAGGALATQALMRPAPAVAAGVVLGATNTASKATKIRTNQALDTAKALVGVVTYTGSGSSTAGVQGQSNAQGGTGVYGVAMSGSSRGVWGRSASGNGVYGEATASSGVVYGVHGTSVSAAGRGVFGENTASDGVGVHGVADNGFGAVGVLGRSRDGVGVRGVATSPGFFTTYGVWGQSDTYEGVGVLASATYPLDTTTFGLWAQSDSNFGTAVMGYASNGTGPNAGVRGECEGSDGTGVFGWGKKSTGVNYGVRGVTQSASGFAGHFTGNTHVQGTFTSSDKQFLIDHPLEPASKTLAHSCVEAPERLNVYRGTVILDRAGTATVRLPSYFGALNREYSYQLTPIGPTSSVLYIAREISPAGTFRIAGGAPAQRVCWQVTATRKDAWAEQHPFRVERVKRLADQGKYLDPALYGKPSSDAIHPLPRPVKRPELGRRNASGEAA